MPCFSAQLFCIISERRIERLLNSALSGLPPFLFSDPGVDSGLMLVQYTAAALVSRNKVLAYPACIGSIPVSATIDDLFRNFAYGSRAKNFLPLNPSIFYPLAKIFCATFSILKFYSYNSFIYVLFTDKTWNVVFYTTFDRTNLRF